MVLRPLGRSLASSDRFDGVVRIDHATRRGRISPGRGGAGADDRPATMQKGTLGQRAWPTITQLARRADSTNWLDPAKVPADWRHFFPEHRLAQALLEMVSCRCFSMRPGPLFRDCANAICHHRRLPSRGRRRQLRRRDPRRLRNRAPNRLRPVVGDRSGDSRRSQSLDVIAGQTDLIVDVCRRTSSRNSDGSRAGHQAPDSADEIID
jgi:hypothetical protein